MKKTLTLVKIGGNIIDDAVALNEFVLAFSEIKGPKILVHGGGKSASKIALQLGLTPQMVDGRRITDAAMLEIVVMVYAGQINKQITALLQAQNTNAIGLSGADGNAIISEKRQHPTIDYGFVGDVISVNDAFIQTLLEKDITPVFCAITHNAQGQLLNTNADTVASQLAITMSKNYDVSLKYCFEKPGVLEDADNDLSVISHLTFERYQDLKAIQKIHSGMIPKLDNCFESIQKGVCQIQIGSLEILKNQSSSGTRIDSASH